MNGHPTYRVVFGVDCGLSGAIAVLRDGQFAGVADMPTIGRGKKGRLQVNPNVLADYFREHVGAAPGAHVFAIIEQTQAMPGQGRSAGHNYGISFGVVIGALAALRIPYAIVHPAKWKKQLNLSSNKEDSRRMATERYPEAPLARKRDDGRAEAILLAHWCNRFEGWIES